LCTFSSNKYLAIELFEESDWIDARVDTFPYLDGLENKWWKPQPVPDFLFIDVDRATLGNNTLLKKALAVTLRNIAKELGPSVCPSVIASGNGLHVLLPLDVPLPLENVTELARIDQQPSAKFLRYLEWRLSRGKADPNHLPSLKSCMLRVPGSYNSKCISSGRQETHVRILQEWNGIRPRPSRRLMYDFRAFLVNERIKAIRAFQKRVKATQQRGSNGLPSTIFWIERLLETPIEDYRKGAIALILVPYLCNVKKLPVDEVYQIVIEWLECCDTLRRLDFRPKRRVTDAIKVAMEKKIPPRAPKP
jgi:hypothetical protein